MISEKEVEAACVAFLWHYGTDLERRHFGCDPDDGHTPETLWSAASEDEREGIRKFMRPALAAALSLHEGTPSKDQIEQLIERHLKAWIKDTPRWLGDFPVAARQDARDLASEIHALIAEKDGDK